MLRLTTVLATLAFANPADSPPGPVLIEVDSGAHNRVQTPVVLPVPPSMAGATGFRLVNVETGQPVRLGRDEGLGPKEVGERSLSWVVTLPPHTKKRFRLIAGNPIDPSPVALHQRDGKATATLGGKSVWTYQIATAEPPAGIERVYRRSGFLHPLATPSGRVVTDDFAADHPHQHGLFFAWTNTTFRGKPMNFWDQLQKTARVENELPWPVMDGSPPSLTTSFFLKHLDITGGEDRPVPVLNERWDLRTYSVESPFLFDLESTQNVAGPEPLMINKYHYGGFGFRGALAWYDPKVKGEDLPDPTRSGESDFLSSDGKTRADGNHTRPRWLDLYGKINGEFAGIAILQHPSNFRFPQPVRLHPNKPYFSVAPAVLGEFKIEPGRPYLSKYRIVLHDGRPDPKELDRLWNDYAEPPTVTILPQP